MAAASGFDANKMGWAVCYDDGATGVGYTIMPIYVHVHIINDPDIIYIYIGARYFHPEHPRF